MNDNLDVAFDDLPTEERARLLFDALVRIKSTEELRQTLLHYVVLLTRNVRYEAALQAIITDARISNIKMARVIAEDALDFARDFSVEGFDAMCERTDGATH